ncbi:MAG: ATP-binding protein [Pseudomonadota bacterium]
MSLFNTPFGSISLLYGPRQIGKTSSLKLFLHQLKDSDTIIYTDCSTILHKNDLRQHLLELIGDATTIVLDEVQSVDGWHLALRSLHADGKLTNCRIWCTGSEARHLLESGERLPGRKGEGKMLFARPWSFREYMDFFYGDKSAAFENVNIKHVNQTWLNDQVIDWKKQWNEYLLCGGFPRVVGEYRNKGRIDDAVWRIYVDWILGSWSVLRTPQRSLAAVARRLCETLNSRVSFESIKKGSDIQSANTIRNLLEIQEDHFSIRVLPRFDLQRKRFAPAKQKKIYPIDPFIARVWASIGYDIRRLFEENVPSLSLDECAFLAQMSRWSENIEAAYLYADKSKSEIDFYYDECAFELKSNGSPTKKQYEILNSAPQSFVVQKDVLPLVAYLIGEGRKKA